VEGGREVMIDLLSHFEIRMIIFKRKVLVSIKEITFGNLSSLTFSTFTFPFNVSLNKQ